MHFLTTRIKFQATRTKSLKKIFFNVWSGSGAFPAHQNQGVKKDIFFTSGVVKNVF
jgi:hypothetical protein